MTVADLGIAVHSESAKTAATDLNALTVASDKAEAASARLDRATLKTNADIAKIAASVEKANAMLAKLVSVGEQTNAALAKMSTVTKTVTVEVQKLDKATGSAATSVGVIAPAVSKNVKALNDNAAAAKLTANQWLNLSRQGNDVVTMFALGAAPMQIFASQIGQIVDALQQGPGGLSGSLRAIGTSILSLVTRFPLVTAAAGAAAVAFAAYELFAEEKIKSVDEVLKQHEANIRRLGPAYEDALKGLQKYVNESANLANLRLRTDASDALRTRADEATKAIENMVKSEGIFSSRFSGAKDAIDAFIASIKAGNPEAIKFQETIAQLVASGRITEKVGQDLITASNAAYEAEQALRGVDGQVNAVAKALSDMAEAMDNDAASALSRLSDAQRKYVEGLIDQLKRGQITADQFKSSLQSLSGVTPDFSGAIAQVSGLADELERANRAALGLANTTPTTRRLGAMDDAQAQYDNALNMWRRFGYDNDAKIDPNKPKKAKVDHSGERDAKAYAQVIKAAQDRIKQMQQEIEFTGKLGAATEAARYEMELVSQATDRGRSISEKQRKQIHDLAEEYGRLKQALAEAKVQQDLLFERQQLLRTPTDQLIADTMRSAGLEVDFNSPIAGAIRFNEQISQTRDLLEGIGQDITSGLTQALEDGKLEWKELGDIALNALSRIADKLIDMAMDQMISGLLGSLFGGGGGLGIFPGGGSLNSTVGLWAKGGAFPNGISGHSNTIVNRPTPFFFAKGAGIMGEAGPEGILPLRRNSQGQLGVIAANDRAANQNQRVQVDIAVSVNDDGTLAVIARQAGGEAADVRIRQYDRNLPNRMQEIQADPRAR